MIYLWFIKVLFMPYLFSDLLMFLHAKDRKPVELLFFGTHLQDAIQYHNSKGVVKRLLGKVGADS